MGRRHPNPRLAKTHRSYSVEELARLFSLHKNTIRGWFRLGLKAIDGQRPTVVRGADVRLFLAERRIRSKRPCGPGRIYCLPCREPKVPALKMAECLVTGDTTGTIRGICPDCGRMIYRRINPQKINSVRGDLDMTFRQAARRIEETAKPNVNCDSTEGGHR
jgi:hypothetical protein